MFDLPTTTTADLREYRYFHKFLVQSGFIMMQESIYTKLAINRTLVDAVKRSVKANLPKEGLIQLLVLTEKQFTSMELLSGSTQKTYCDSDCRLVEL